MNEIQALIDAMIHSAGPQPNPPESQQTPDGQQGQIFRQQALLQLVQHPKQQVRQEAAELLAEHPCEPAFEALSQLAQDDSAEVRLQAILSLETFRDFDPTPVLLSALKDPDYLVRASAAETLGAQGADPTNQLTEALLGLLKDEVYTVRATAAEALGRMEAFLAVPALQDLLLDNDQWVRYSAAESLNQIEPDEAIWALLMDANSKEPISREEAVKALGECVDRRAIPALMRMLKDEPTLGSQILLALQKFHDPLVVPALVETALFTHQADLREQALIEAQEQSLDATVQALADWLDSEHLLYAQRAIEVLNQLPTQETNPVFVYALQHSDPWVRTVGMLTLQNRKVAAPLAQLENLLQQENDPDLLRAALTNLIEHHPQQSLDYLQTFATSEADWQRLVLAENLHRLPYDLLTTDLESLKSLLSDPSSDVREAAMQSIGQIGHEACLPYLLTGSQDPDAWVRQAAVAGLENDLSPAACERLIACLQNDEDFLVRARAAEALGAHHSEASQAALQTALDDDKPSVRVQAVRSLFNQGQPPALESVAKMLSDTARNVLLTTLEQIRRQQGSAYQHLLAQHLEAADPQIHSAAQAAYASPS